MANKYNKHDMGRYSFIFVVPEEEKKKMKKEGKERLKVKRLL